MKRAGVKAGVPDILVVHGGFAFFIELKADKGRVSVAQEIVRDALGMAGAKWCCCRSIDDVAFILNQWNVPLRARAA